MATVFNASISYILDNSLEKYKELFIAFCKKEESFPRGTILSRSGNLIPYMYFMLDGMAKVYTMNPGGYVRILGYHKGYSFFAMDGICENEPAVVTTEAVTPVRVLTVTWDELYKMAEADPTFMPAMLRYYGKVLRLMCFDAESKSICDASARLAGFLCLYQNSLRESDDGKIALTQDDLASAVNSSRVQIARLCSEFKQRGLIRCSRGSVTVLNREALIKLSQYR